MGKEITPSSAALEQIMGNAELAPDDSTDITRSIVEGILRAQSVDEVFQEIGTTATKDFVGQPIKVLDVKLNEGQLEGEKTVYMLINAVVLATGESIILNSGAPNIVGKLWRLRELGKLPINVAVKEVAGRGGGQNAVLSLERLPDTAPATK
jgi:hypothetical protein